MQKGQTGIYHQPNGAAAEAVVERVRGGNQVDVLVGGMLLQMVDVGTAAEEFWPHGFEAPEAPPPALPARLVPRYIPVWHAIVLGVPVAAGTAALFEVIWHLLTR